MSEMMTFPDTWEEFEKSYGFTDNEEVYTNGARLIPSFRVKQWLEHMPSAEKPFKLPEIYVAEGYDTIEDEDGNIGFGVYAPAENQIYVVGDVEDEIRARALLHEVCHWVQAMCGRPFYEDEANEFSDIVYDVLTPVQPDVPDTNVGELISRQAAIDEIDEWIKAFRENGHKESAADACLIQDGIIMLPSAQPETNCSEIPNNSDLISRQAAIDALDKRFDSVPMEQTTEILMLRKDLRELPSAHPRRGKWARHFDGNEWYWYCSSCKEQWYEEDLWMGGNSFPNFCPNCGCRMEEGDSDAVN